MVNCFRLNSRDRSFDQRGLLASDRLQLVGRWPVHSSPLRKLLHLTERAGEDDRGCSSDGIAGDGHVVNRRVVPVHRAARDGGVVGPVGLESRFGKRFDSSMAVTQVRTGGEDALFGQASVAEGGFSLELELPAYGVELEWVVSIGIGRHTALCQAPQSGKAEEHDPRLSDPRLSNFAGGGSAVAASA